MRLIRNRQKRDLVRPPWFRLGRKYHSPLGFLSLLAVFGGLASFVLLPVASLGLAIAGVVLGVCWMLVDSNAQRYGCLGDMDIRIKWVEGEVDAADREIANLLLGHRSYAEECGIEIDRSKPPVSRPYVIHRGFS